MASLPGQNKDNPPPLPNVGPQPVSPETQEAIARWNSSILFTPIPKSLAEILAQHPEYVSWGVDSVVGRMEIIPRKD
jgi:hypothetical protein